MAKLKKRFHSSYALDPGHRRTLQIFAADPMVGRRSSYRVSIDVPYEPLDPGPCGQRLQVIDYDATNKRYYEPVDLNEPQHLMQDGLDPNESDPRFHQQMVYAVSAKTLENFERALGRRLRFTRRGSPRLRLFPHAFHGANAYFDPKMNAIVFGYFRADESEHGAAIPGQNVYTCLSHDIIAHEMTHAIVHRLRRYFLEPTNVDVVAFHEAFSDIVALFQHFSFGNLLRDHIQEQRTSLRNADLLIGLAQEFGYATGGGKALRSALKPGDRNALETTFEPHLRGSILVGAVFSAFFEIYQRRIKDLIRIATGGTGELPRGDLHPDLVNRVAMEAGETADSILTKCIRAFDYLPPVDVNFGDFLRALITADFVLDPVDTHDRRHAIIEAFRERGIYPDGVGSLAEEALMLAEPDLEPLPESIVEEAFRSATQSLTGPGSCSGHRHRGGRDDALEHQYRVTFETDEDELENARPRKGRSNQDRRRLSSELHAYAVRNAARLGLAPHHASRPIALVGFHQSFSMAQDGQLVADLVAQFIQTDRSKSASETMPLRGGVTIVAKSTGDVRYIASKPFPSPLLKGQYRVAAGLREEKFREFLRMTDLRDPKMAWGDSHYVDDRVRQRMDFRSLHQGMS